MTFPTIDAIISELLQMRALQQENAILRNNLGFQEMAMREIARIVKLPPDKTMADLAAWIRDNWKP